MQANREHFWGRRALGVKRIERVLEIGEELIARREALRRREPHVVGIERVGHYELRPPRSLDPIGQVVGVGVGAIEEAALLHAERERVDRRAPLVEPKRALADDLGMDPYGLGDVFGFLVGGRIAVVDPFVAVGRDLPTRFLHRRGDLRIARQRGRDGEYGRGSLTLGEHSVQPPKAGARSVFIDRLHVHVALARPGRGAHDLGEKRLRCGVAVQNIVLAALFVVDHELQRDPRPARPIGERRRPAVADHVARIRLLHGIPLQVQRRSLR